MGTREDSKITRSTTAKGVEVHMTWLNDKMTVQVKDEKEKGKWVDISGFEFFSEKTRIKGVNGKWSNVQPTRTQTQTLRKWKDSMEKRTEVAYDKAHAKWKIDTLNGTDPHGYHLKPHSVRR